MSQDPAKFWRDNSMHHQERADFWKKTARVLAGVLTAIVLVITIVLVKS